MRYISREEWGGVLPTAPVTYLQPERVERVFVHHTTGAQQDDKAKWVRSIQRFHIQERGWSDIAYSVLVDADGAAYIGRGFGRQGAHTAGWNSRSIAVAYLGSGLEAVPTAALQSIRRVIEDASLWFGRPLPVYGHCDVGSTVCPGGWLLSWVREGMPVADPLPRADVAPFPLHPDDPLRGRSDAPPHLLGENAVSRRRSAAEDGDGNTHTTPGTRSTQQVTVRVPAVPDLRDGWRRHLDRMRRRRG